MNGDKCPACGAKAIPPSLYDGLARYECGEGPCDPCPNAESLLAEARAMLADERKEVDNHTRFWERLCDTLGMDRCGTFDAVVERVERMRTVVEAAAGYVDEQAGISALCDAVDAYRGTR